MIRFLEIESHNESMGQWVNGSDGSMGRMGPGSMGQWVMGLGYDGSDGSWVTNGDP